MTFEEELEIALKNYKSGKYTLLQTKQRIKDILKRCAIQMAQQFIGF